MKTFNSSSLLSHFIPLSPLPSHSQTVPCCCFLCVVVIPPLGVLFTVFILHRLLINARALISVFLFFPVGLFPRMLCTKPAGNNRVKTFVSCNTIHSCKSRSRKRFCTRNIDKVTSLRSKDVCLAPDWQVMDLFVPWTVTVSIPLGREVLRTLS